MSKVRTATLLTLLAHVSAIVAQGKPTKGDPQCDRLREVVDAPPKTKGPGLVRLASEKLASRGVAVPPKPTKGYVAANPRAERTTHPGRRAAQAIPDVLTQRVEHAIGHKYAIVLTPKELKALVNK